MTSAKGLAVRVLGTRPVSAAVELVLRRRLRVVAYHGVPNAELFRRQLDLVVSRYDAVSGADVVDSLNGGSPLPERAVWITFDDGHANVVERALPMLRERRMTATMFVCPGLVDAGAAPWWEVIESAADCGWTADQLPSGEYVKALKSMPDGERRSYLAAALEFSTHAADGSGSALPVAGRAQLEAWMSAGMELGNHTWDHPCLDRCTGDEQRRQIVEADRWLENMGAFERCRLFAYPNGDWTPDSERVLDELDYDIALLFDHRVANIVPTNPLRVSRVRLDTAAPIERARAILSGGHSMVYRPAPMIPAPSGDAA